MNVYDWDNTVYRGDSTCDFILWLYMHRPLTLLSVFRTAGCAVLYGLHVMPKLTFKQYLYHMFVFVKDMDKAADEFTSSHMNHVKSWYLVQKKEDDMIISASPEFTIQRFCHQLGIQQVIASVVDPQTGKYTGLNCHGAEKVRRFKERMTSGTVEEFYSDSLSDAPLAGLAEKAYLVKGNNRLPWPEK